MANKCFVAIDSDIDDDDKPFTREDFDTRISKSQPLKWDFAKEGYAYDPYLVRFVFHDAKVLRFFFIDCATGKEFGVEHTVDSKDAELFFPGSPSTLPTADDYNAKRTIGFLMLNPHALERTGLYGDAKNANTDIQGVSGKWPGTAAGAVKYEELKKENAKLRDENRELTEQYAVAQNLKAEAIARSEELSDFLRDLAKVPGIPSSIKNRIDAMVQ